MKLEIIGIIRREEKHRSFGDRRRKVNHVTASYLGQDGLEYRKSFESYSDPIVPTSGSNAEITKLKIQY
jgi:hypothetical protein